MIEVRVLSPDVVRSTFRSGDPDLDRFFHKYAGQSQFRYHLGVTYIAVQGEQVLGFATVAAGQIDVAHLPADRHAAGLPRHPLPILRLARLAVSEAARGRGIGQLLVRFVLGLAQATAGQIGCVGVVVDAKAGAVAFYDKLGFVPLRVVSGGLGDRPAPLPMFLALGSVPRGQG